MMTNVGIIDRFLRLAIGLALLAWAEGYLGPAPEAGIGTMVTLPGAYLAITGFLRWCPLFALAGVSTCAEDF